ncbi:MAG: GNAT family N-acetyltransferase [Armatimonadetes bacterium]|nr:GNAT family N-acetyltransferase [Armatimonadota bacterium]
MPSHREPGGEPAAAAKGCRTATPADLPAIAVVHRAAFPDFFTTELGPSFLRAYYRAVLEYAGGVLVVHEADGAVSGFAAGFCAPEGFYQELRGRKLQLAAALLPTVLRRPRMLRRIVHNFRRGAGDEPVGPSDSSELSSIAVAPAQGGRGIGRALIEEFVRRSGEGGARYVYLTTDADANEPVIGFYEAVGFTVHHTFEGYAGRRMHEFRREGR